MNIFQKQQHQQQRLPQADAVFSLQKWHLNFAKFYLTNGSQMLYAAGRSKIDGSYILQNRKEVIEVAEVVISLGKARRRRRRVLFFVKWASLLVLAFSVGFSAGMLVHRYQCQKQAQKATTSVASAQEATTQEVEIETLEVLPPYQGESGTGETPEPTTIVVLGAGIATLLIGSRRAKRR